MAVDSEQHVVLDIGIPILVERQPCGGMRAEEIQDAIRDVHRVDRGLDRVCDVDQLGRVLSRDSDGVHGGSLLGSIAAQSRDYTAQTPPEVTIYTGGKGGLPCVTERPAAYT